MRNVCVYVCVYIYIYICVCVCVCVWRRIYIQKLFAYMYYIIFNKTAGKGVWTKKN